MKHILESNWAKVLGIADRDSYSFYDSSIVLLINVCFADTVFIMGQPIACHYDRKCVCSEGFSLATTHRDAMHLLHIKNIALSCSISITEDQVTDVQVVSLTQQCSQVLFLMRMNDYSSIK